MTIPNNAPTQGHSASSARWTWLLLAAIFVSVQFASLFSPPLLDDVDAAHAQAAQTFAESGGWITPQINGVRYLEKPPMTYWLVANAYRVFGENAFATHLPNALAMLGLAWLCWRWASRAWGPRAGLYAGLGALTSVGPFLFTRFIIPESILSLLLLAALYLFLTGLEFDRPMRFYWMWAALAVALLTKGLIAPLFFAGATIPYLIVTGQWSRVRSLKLISGPLLFLAIAAPWHILAGIANPGQGSPSGNHPTVGNVHGFWYFYFINEHVLRFLDQRYPHDYFKLPFAVYWLLHLVWLFPWSLFLPAVLVFAWRTRNRWRAALHFHLAGSGGDALREPEGFAERSIYLLSFFAIFTLVFFSISTNQEYYTFPAWPPLFILIAALLANMEGPQGIKMGNSRTLSTSWLTGAHAIFAVVGALVSAALGWGLWESRHLPFVPDIGTLLAHRAVADYTLSMSHLFDLTGPSFAALRLPAVLAATGLLAGPAAGWILRVRGQHLAATLSVALTSAVFLIAAHIAFARFDPMLGSKTLADTIIQKGSPEDSFIIWGEQSDASSVIFYTHKFLHKPAMTVVPVCGQHGEGSTLLWGSCYTDAPKIFLSEDALSKIWGTGERKWIFAEDANQLKTEKLLGDRLYPVQSIADKAMWTDRPLKGVVVSQARASSGPTR